MINGIIGRKIGMTQIFAADGRVTPVTVIKAGPCVVVQKKSSAGADGYNAVQVGLVDERPPKLKNVTKPMRGHFEKTGGGVPPTTRKALPEAVSYWLYSSVRLYVPSNPVSSITGPTIIPAVSGLPTRKLAAASTRRLTTRSGRRRRVGWTTRSSSSPAT